MFLDLNNSTAIAAALGPFRFNDFKNDFFYDIAEPILETRGQIYQYVGDEAVVTWTVERGLHQGNCLRCVFLVMERIHEQKERYLARYGMVPESPPRWGPSPMTAPVAVAVNSRARCVGTRRTSQCTSRAPPIQPHVIQRVVLAV